MHRQTNVLAFLDVCDLSMNFLNRNQHQHLFTFVAFKFKRTELNILQ
jgi:hypothetical protein